MPVSGTVEMTAANRATLSRIAVSPVSCTELQIYPYAGRSAQTACTMASQQ